MTFSIIGFGRTEFPYYPDNLQIPEVSSIECGKIVRLGK